MTKDDPFRSDRGAFFAAMQPFDSPADTGKNDDELDGDGGAQQQPEPAAPEAPVAEELTPELPTLAPRPSAAPSPPAAAPPNRAADLIDALLDEEAPATDGAELTMAGRRATDPQDPASTLDDDQAPEAEEPRHEDEQSEAIGTDPTAPGDDSNPDSSTAALEPQTDGGRRWSPRATLKDLPRAAAHSIRHRPSPASTRKMRKSPLAWSIIAIIACVLVGSLFVTQGSGSDTKGVSIASSAPPPPQPDSAAGGGPKPTNGGLEGDEPIKVLKAVDRCPSGSTPAMDAFQNKPSGLGWVCIRANNSDGQLLTVTFDKKYVLSAVNVVPGANIIDSGGIDQWYKNCIVTRLSVTVKEKGRTADGQPVTGYAEFSTGNRRDIVSMPVAGWVTGEVLIRILETTKVTNPNPPQQDQAGGAGGSGLPGFTFGNEPTGANTNSGGGQTEQCPNYSSKEVTRFALGMIQFIGHPAA